MRFKLLPDDQDAERHKWVLSAEAQGEAEYQVLQGWRMVRALGQVRALQRTTLSVTPKALEKWSVVQYLSVVFYVRS